MKFINLTSGLSQSEVLDAVKDNEFVNSGVKFEGYEPHMYVRQSKKNPNKIRITCEMKNTATKDNGFLVGTYFSGKFKEKDGVTYLKGYIATAPIYHLVLLAFIAFFIYRCISIGGFNPVPVILVVFDIFMFWREFKKQGLIERYLARAVRRLEIKEGKLKN